MLVEIMLKSTIIIFLMTNAVVSQDIEQFEPAIESSANSIAKTITREYQTHRVLSPRRIFRDETNKDEKQKLRKGLRDGKRGRAEKNSDGAEIRDVSKREARKSKNKNIGQSNKTSRRDKNTPSNEAVNTNGKVSDKINKNNKRNNKESIAEKLAKSKIVARSLATGSSKKNRNRIQSKNNLSQRSNNSEFPVKYPKIRYTRWEDLSADTRAILGKTLGYKRPTWEKLGSHDVEKKTFEDFNFEEQAGLMMLGLGGYVWDCFVNHYESYDRKDQVRIGVFDHVESLNKSMSKRWKDLTDNEKDSANQLCYFEESWDGKSLADW